MLEEDRLGDLLGAADDERAVQPGERRTARGSSGAPAIAAPLIRHGRRQHTPAAVVIDGTTGRERAVRTTLEQPGTTIRDEDVRPPAVWVVGAVVQLAAATAHHSSI